MKCRVKTSSRFGQLAQACGYGFKEHREKSQSSLTPAGNGVAFLRVVFVDALPYLQVHVEAECDRKLFEGILVSITLASTLATPFGAIPLPGGDVDFSSQPCVRRSFTLRDIAFNI